MPTEPDKQGLLFAVGKPERHAASYGAMMRVEPLSRGRDSLGSFRAADRLGRSGLGSKRRLAVYHALRRAQGSTSAELAKTAGMDRHDVARRLPELQRGGWVTRGGMRMCRVCRVPCLTWYIVRTWLDKTDGQRQAVPRQRQAGSPPAAPGATAGGAGQSTARAGLGPIPANVLSPAERQRLRRRLADEGDTWASGYGVSHDSSAASAEGVRGVEKL